MKRVYHPTADAFQDVADDAVKAWTEAGWRKTKPAHVDDSERPEVGSFAPVDVPREPVFLEPDDESAAEKPVAKPRRRAARPKAKRVSTPPIETADK